MVLEAALLGLLVGLFAKGSFGSIVHKRFHHLWLVFVSVAFQAFVGSGLMARLLTRPGADGTPPVLADETLPLVACTLLQYGTLAAFLLINWAKPGLRLVLVGSLLNAAAILGSGGRMPVGPAVAAYGTDRIEAIRASANYVYAPDGAPLSFLGDILPVHTIEAWMVSPGDLVIAVGVFLFAWYLVRRPRPARGAPTPSRPRA